MFERWYKIEGITHELLEAWGDGLREDLVIYEDNYGEIHTRIKLNPIEAFRMNRSIKSNNYGQPYYKLKLVLA